MWFYHRVMHPDGKQCRPWSDCSFRNSLIWVYTVCQDLSVWELRTWPDFLMENPFEMRQNTLQWPKILMKISKVCVAWVIDQSLKYSWGWFGNAKIDFNAPSTLQFMSPKMTFLRQKYGQICKIWVSQSHCWSHLATFSSDKSGRGRLLE